MRGVDAVIECEHQRSLLPAGDDLGGDRESILFATSDHHATFTGQQLADRCLLSGGDLQMAAHAPAVCAGPALDHLVRHSMPTAHIDQSGEQRLGYAMEISGSSQQPEARANGPAAGTGPLRFVLPELASERFDDLARSLLAREGYVRIHAKHQVDVAGSLVGYASGFWFSNGSCHAGSLSRLLPLRILRRDARKARIVTHGGCGGRF